MPKHKSKPVAATEQQIQLALKKLDDHYIIGKQLRAERPSGKEARRQIAAGSSVNTNDSNLQKTRQLADLVGAELDDKSAEEVWQQLRDLRLKGTDLPLSWSHVVALVSAGSRTKLMQVAKLAARHGWSASQTRQHLQRESGHFSRRPGTGQKIREPKNLLVGLQQLQADLEVVRKRVEVLLGMVAAMSGANEITNKLVVLAEAVKALSDGDEVQRMIGSADSPPDK